MLSVALGVAAGEPVSVGVGVGAADGVPDGVVTGVGVGVALPAGAGELADVEGAGVQAMAGSRLVAPFFRHFPVTGPPGRTPIGGS